MGASSEWHEHGRPSIDVVGTPAGRARRVPQRGFDLFEQPDDALHLAQGERAAELCAVEAFAQQRGSAREAGLDVAAGLPEHRAEGLQRLPIAAAPHAPAATARRSATGA